MASEAEANASEVHDCAMCNRKKAQRGREEGPREVSHENKSKHNGEEKERRNSTEPQKKQRVGEQRVAKIRCNIVGGGRWQRFAEVGRG